MLWGIEINEYIYIEIICINDDTMSFAIQANILVVQTIFPLKSQTLHVIELTC